MIYIASDHGGYKLKENLKRFLKKEKIEFFDCGTDSEKMVDYPIFAKVAIDGFLQNKCDKIILCCGSGVGNCIYANRFKGIYAVNPYSAKICKVARQHNNANALCLGGRFLSLKKAQSIVKVFLETPYLGGRYDRRIELIDK